MRLPLIWFWMEKAAVRLTDQVVFSFQLFSRHRVRTLLLLLAVGSGVASVILLTSLGEGARSYIDREFSSIGNNLLVAFPGKTETTGGMPPMYGAVPRDLTLEDAEAMARVPGIRLMAPIIAGTALVSREARSREAITMGSTQDFFSVRQLVVARGQPLPPRASTEALSVAVLGSRLKRELFGGSKAVGEWLRVGDRRFRVVGVLQERGESFGADMRDIIVIPVRSAEQLFNTAGLFRIILELKRIDNIDAVERRLRDVIRERHEGDDDITLVSQDSMLSAFNDILNAITLSIGAIAAISLLVAGILIMNISLISVSQRRGEIGLLKAIGASRKQVRMLFLGESMVLTLTGCLCGIAFALIVVGMASRLWPNFPIAPPLWSFPAATATALLSALFFSWLPSRRAAELDPVLALRGQA